MKSHEIWWNGLTWECPCGYSTDVDSDANKHVMDPHSTAPTDLQSKTRG
jgi:hypothetical protein